MHSPLGPLTIFEDGGAIVALEFGRAVGTSETPLLTRAKDQLDAYFARARQDFKLPLTPRGSDFQRAVWDQMCAIPYGATTTYGDVARHLGSAARAVGGAGGANPLPLVITSPRGNGAGGRNAGDCGGGGIETKLALLRLEGYRLL